MDDQVILQETDRNGSAFPENKEPLKITSTTKISKRPRSNFLLFQTMLRLDFAMQSYFTSTKKFNLDW